MAPPCHGRQSVHLKEAPKLLRAQIARKRGQMTITLNHTIVPAHDKAAAAAFFAQIFGLRFDRTDGHFAPVRVNETLTLLFDNDETFESHHLAFHVDDTAFDAILARVK